MVVAGYNWVCDRDKVYSVGQFVVHFLAHMIQEMWGLVLRLQEMRFGSDGAGMCWAGFRADKRAENIIDVVVESL